MQRQHWTSIVLGGEERSCETMSCTAKCMLAEGQYPTVRQRRMWPMVDDHGSSMTVHPPLKWMVTFDIFVDS